MPDTQPVTFPAANGGPRLQGVLHLPDASAPRGYAVVCHPHPQMGGTMDNNVVVAVCRVLVKQQWAALRFNFRGAFDKGRGEMDDVAGALDFLLEGKEAEPNHVAVIGYSFGAQVGLHHAARDIRVRRLVGIALVQDHYTDPFLDDDTRPKLFIAGERDAWAPPCAMDKYVARLKPPKTLHVIQGTDHFFAGYESRVGTQVADWLGEAL